ncbi:TadE/TadG family type IV pilus assembly protein [Luteococcus sp. H138]|uniref:TadE/TadG family type IV pilus assembly protein n=1 Tax=unclassified Luteococcus TaxID=2639923 RepID=UPI00313B4FD6
MTTAHPASSAFSHHPAPGGRPGRCDERGLSESVQWAVLMPLVLLAILGLIQSGIWLHGRSAAANAALAGAEAQALHHAAGGTGERVAREVAEGAGLLDVRVAVAAGPQEVSVEVTGRVDTFFVIGTTQVRSRAVMPQEGP